MLTLFLVGEVAFSIIPRIEFFGYEMSKVIFVNGL